MKILGLQKLALVDFPGKVAATIFTGGCNLRCTFCHNAPLVLRESEQPVISQEEVFSFLNGRKGLLDGVVISGGEPLMQPGLTDFLRQLRPLGFAVKLDTNGCFPDALGAILAEGLVDYVAMDIKNSREKYAQTVAIPNFSLTAVDESIRLLRSSGIPFEFRTTAVRELHTAEDIRAIGRWLQGAPLYTLQQFVDSGDLVGGGCTPLDEEGMQELAEAARPWFDQVVLRGVD